MVLDTRRILVVEDDALVAGWLCEVLQDLGFLTIGPASTGPEALSLAELHKPNIAIVDIQLSSEMDGIDVARAFDDRFGIAVIFLSGLCDEDVMARAQTAHPVSFLHKPFRAGALLAAIEIARGVRSAAKTRSPNREEAPDRASARLTRAESFGRRRGDHCRKPPAGVPFGQAE
jgi:DNA-binding response OmpR family regulator